MPSPKERHILHCLSLRRIHLAESRRILQELGLRIPPRTRLVDPTSVRRMIDLLEEHDIPKQRWRGWYFTFSVSGFKSKVLPTLLERRGKPKGRAR